MGNYYNVVLSVGSLSTIYNSSAVYIGSTASGVTITSPTTLSTVTGHSGGPIAVTYNVTGSGGTATIQVGNGSVTAGVLSGITATVGTNTSYIPIYSSDFGRHL